MGSLLIAMISLYFLPTWGQTPSITKLSDYKKVQIQFSKPLQLGLTDFVRDYGRKASTEKKTPNYRLLYESNKLWGPEDTEGRLSCTVYQKLMLSNRLKNYNEEAVKFEKMITDKEVLNLSAETSWIIVKASPNDLGILLWLQADKKTLQMDCEKKNEKGEEKAILPQQLLNIFSENQIRLLKDGKDLLPPVTKTEDISVESTPSETP